MYNLNKRTLILISVNLALIVGCCIMLTKMYLDAGISATWLLVFVISVTFIASLISIVNTQLRQLIHVVRALANGDSSLGLAPHHPMCRYFDQVKQQVQTTRMKVEHQSEFLKALLVHIDLAVIVCDNQGTVVESNPAVARLLGKPIKHIDDLGQVGKLFMSATKGLLSTVQWHQGETLDTLAIHVSLAQIQGHEFKILTLQSIHESLINKEQQAYKRLTQVLTHEVANTITPLASIAQTCQGLLPNELCFADEENKQDLHLALQTLASRTKHMGKFIASFREISRLPKPQLVPTSLEDIIEIIQALHQQQLAEANIGLSIDVQVRQLVMLDSAQIEQVLINLIKNAIESLQLSTNQRNIGAGSAQANGQIKITLGQNDAEQLFVEVANNGSEIPDHVREMIFVPFFTTKQTGTGIGLSLSKQIMINHGGDLVYIARPDGACFRCIFG